MTAPSTSPDFVTISRHSPDHGPIDLEVAVLGDSAAPLILFIHGWPECWASWRFQMAHFAERGHRTAAMNVRGYGGSSKPEAIEAYRLTELCADAAAVIEELSPDGSAIVVGHDWGAPIAWNTARLHPEAVRAVVGLSVPYSPSSAGDPMELWEAFYPGKFFYMKYFREVGVAEAAFNADLERAIRKVTYAISGDAPAGVWTQDAPDGAALLDLLPDPDPIPQWMAGDALQPTIDALASGPIHGPFHRYRAQALDGAEIEGRGEPILAQPSCFIAGAEDAVRRFVPGMDMYADPGAALADFRGSTLIDGIGHWVQQEAPDATNAALSEFIDSLS